MMRITKKFLKVNGHLMAYVEQGTGTPMIFLHGNLPTISPMSCAKCSTAPPC
jgi:hypothetical protein